jgi:exonuclease VII small subunit
MLVHKFNAAITKLDTAKDKISKLIDKAAAAGKDTTAMTAHLTTYQTEIDAAKAAIANAKAKFLAMKVSDPAGAKTLFQDGKALLKTAKTHLIAAHKELQATIPLLRVALGGSKEATESASESAH